MLDSRLTENMHKEAHAFAQRWPTSGWTLLLRAASNIESDFLQHLLDNESARQIRFGRLMDQYDGNPVGVECSDESSRQWAFVAQDATSPGQAKSWRVQTFDANGFIGHTGFSSMQSALEHLVRHYPVQDPGALDRCAAKVQWAQGLEIQAAHDQMTRGVIAFQEFLVRVSKIKQSQVLEAQYDAV